MTAVIVFVAGMSEPDSRYWQEDALVTMFIGAPATYLFLKIFYYRVVLYIIYGKNFPSKS